MITNEKKLSLGKKLKENKLTPEQKTEIRNLLWYDDDFIMYCKNKKDWTHEEHDNLLSILEIPKNESGYYVDKFGEKVSYNGIRTLKRSHTQLELSEIHKNEIQKCKDDIFYFRNYYNLIITKDGLKRPEFRQYQNQLINSLIKLKDTVILYPRQSGKTITASVYLLWGALTKENINIGIVANKGPTAAEVLDKIKKIFIEMPIWLQLGIEVWNKGNVEFDNGVRILTDSPSSDSFRGYTINILYIDELAYIPKKDYDEFSDSVFPTMNSLSFRQFIATSTANGMNHFAELVKKAKQPDTEYEYVECSWTEVPRYDKNGQRIPPEKYKEQTIKKHGLQYFLQTEACEFLGSSSTLVSGEALKRIQEHTQNVQLLPSLFKGLNVYKKPEKNHVYIMSVDSSKDGIDDFSINVIDVTKFPFEQVADANLQVDYIVMPEYLVELGEFYNNALCVIENNEGSGQSIADAMWNIYSYPNMYKDKKLEGQVGFKKYPGFRTTPKTRSQILGLLKVFIEENKLIINSKITLSQLYTFTKNDNDKYIAEDGYKDDNIMSLAIAFAPFKEIKQYDNYELFIDNLRKNVNEIPETHVTEYISALDFGFNDTDETQTTSFEQAKKMIQDTNVEEIYGVAESNSIYEGIV